eukprot:6193524-Pleurochrysis_carterae.AAC.3
MLRQSGARASRLRLLFLGDGVELEESVTEQVEPRVARSPARARRIRRKGTSAPRSLSARRFECPPCCCACTEAGADRGGPARNVAASDRRGALRRLRAVAVSALRLVRAQVHLPRFRQGGGRRRRVRVADLNRIWCGCGEGCVNCVRISVEALVKLGRGCEAATKSEQVCSERAVEQLLLFKGCQYSAEMS